MIIVMLLSLVVTAAAIPSNYVLSAKDNENSNVAQTEFNNSNDEIPKWPNLTPIDLILNMIKIAENNKNENSKDSIFEQSTLAPANDDENLTDSSQDTNSNEISNLNGYAEQNYNDTVSNKKAKPFVFQFIRIIEEEKSPDSKSVENKLEDEKCKKNSEENQGTTKKNIEERKLKEPLEKYSDENEVWFHKLLKNNDLISSPEVSQTDLKGSEQQNNVEKENVSNESDIEKDKSTVNQVLEEKNSKETDHDTPGIQYNVEQTLDEQNKEIKPESQEKVPYYNYVENNEHTSNNEREENLYLNTPTTSQAIPFNPLITEYTTNKPYVIQNLPEENVITIPESDSVDKNEESSYIYGPPIEFVPEVINERPSFVNRPSFLSGLFSYLPSFPASSHFFPSFSFSWPWKYPSHIRLPSESYPEYAYKNNNEVFN